MKNFIWIILACLPLMSGCLTATAVTALGVASTVVPMISAGVGGVALWKNGEGTKYYDYEQKTVYNSAKHAFQRLNLPITQDNGKELKAGTKDRFYVKVVKCQGNITRVSIRVNFMGDKEYAKLIFKCMDDQLPVVKFDSKQLASKKTSLPTVPRLFNKSAF